jgi:hypothetical protein
MRSRKRRRAEGLSVKMRSIAGVSQKMESRSPSCTAGVSAPLTRRMRRPGLSGLVPVPMRMRVVAGLRQVGGHREGAVAALPRHLGQGGAAQATAGGEEADRFEDVRLARAVFAQQQVEGARSHQRGVAVVAEPGKADAVERHGRAVTGLAWRRYGGSGWNFAKYWGNAGWFPGARVESPE